MDRPSRERPGNTGTRPVRRHPFRPPLPDSRGLATFEQLRKCAPRIPVVVLTGLDDEGLALRAVREGAQDYLVKGA